MSCQTQNDDNEESQTGLQAARICTGCSVEKLTSCLIVNKKGIQMCFTLLWFSDTVWFRNFSEN